LTHVDELVAHSLLPLLLVVAVEATVAALLLGSDDAGERGLDVAAALVVVFFYLELDASSAAAATSLLQLLTLSLTVPLMVPFAVVVAVAVVAAAALDIVLAASSGVPDMFGGKTAETNFVGSLSL
jgi:hypothetical protein